MTEPDDPAATAGRASARLAGEVRRGDRGENRLPPAVAVVVAGLGCRCSSTTCMCR